MKNNYQIMKKVNKKKVNIVIYVIQDFVMMMKLMKKKIKKNQIKKELNFLKIFKKLKIMIFTQENSEDLNTYYAVQDIKNKETYQS